MHTLIDNSKTDKNTTHSYLPTYQKIFANKKETAKHILEIGIGDNFCSSGNGGSIKLWHDYFQNATIHALDIISFEYQYKIAEDVIIESFLMANVDFLVCCAGSNVNFLSRAINPNLNSITL